MEVNVYDLKGSLKKKIKLPNAFNEYVRPEIIRRAVLSEESKMYQPKGSYALAGLQTSARYIGRKEAYATLKNKGMAMLPREFYGGGIPGRVRRIPSAVSGRRAHPPKPEKILIEKMNKKEWILAFKSALSACTKKDLVEKRHKVKAEAYPLVFEDEFEKIKKTKEVYGILNTIIGEDLTRAKQGRKRKTGVRKTRKVQKIRYPKSVLIITHSKMKSAKNLPGVEVLKYDEVKVKNLAPGALAGRLLIFTEKALEKFNKIEEVFLK